MDLNDYREKIRGVEYWELWDEHHLQANTYSDGSPCPLIERCAPLPNGKVLGSPVFVYRSRKGMGELIKRQRKLTRRSQARDNKAKNLFNSLMS